MLSAFRKIGITVSITAGIVGMGAGLVAVPALADGQGATTIPCSDIFPDLGGTFVINSNGVLVNCYEHTPGDGGGAAAGSSAEVIDCSEALGFPAQGIAVTTPTGSVLVNCHPHFI
jgi:hypothetical protein